MARARKRVGLVMGCLLLWSGAASAWAAPGAADVLKIRPKQPGVNCSTPAAEEQKACQVERLRGTAPGLDGWLVRDAQGRILRRFADTNGDGQLDTWSYYLNGEEVYREIDTNNNRRADQFRWLNSGGMKWGVNSDDSTKTRIDTWKMISAEEVSQEVLQAVIAKDFARLQALWITDAELDSLGLPEAEGARIHSLKDKAQAKFLDTCAKAHGIGARTRWNHLDAGAPQCLPAGADGLKQDLIKQTKASVLYQDGQNPKQIQTLRLGEMIQVGQAWRILDAPSSDDVIKDGDGPDGAQVTPEMQKLLDELTAMERTAPKGQTTVGSNPAVVEYNLRRAAALQQIIDLLGRQHDERHQDQWVRQLADCYSEAAQTSSDTDKSAYEQLVQLEAKTVQTHAGSPLAAYVTFREMSADYAVKLTAAGPNGGAKVQEERVGRLTKFIEDYPQAEDAADALMQLAMISEFNGKEIEAKKWYERLTGQFPRAGILTTKAQGALRRLDLEGKDIELTGQKLGGGNFDIKDLHGKLVIVYYWASWNQQCVGDFARLKLLLSNHPGDGIEVVCINLDSAPPEADSLAARMQAPGIQLYQPGGLDSPLATQYGVMVLPNMFLVGRDGKVISRTVQIATLEDEIKKQHK